MRPVSDETTTRDDDTVFRCAPAAEAQETDETSEQQPSVEDAAPEEAGYGYGV